MSNILGMWLKGYLLLPKYHSKKDKEMLKYVPNIKF